jgi:hypothetical protein
LATEDEVVASKRRKHDVESANYVGAALPLWAHNLQQALQQQMTAMQQALQQEMQQNVQRITRVILQESQRSINRSRHSNAKRIERVTRVDDGQIPGPHIWLLKVTSFKIIMSLPQRINTSFARNFSSAIHLWLHKTKLCLQTSQA